MGLNIVGNSVTVNKFKRSRYFRQNLGLAATKEKNDRRVMNDDDKFAFHYNSQYKTIIYGQGNIGDIKFYVDHYILDESFGVYSGESFEEFVFKFNDETINGKGIDFYMGHIIKNVEEEYEERVKKEELRKAEPIPDGNADILTVNPGNVTYADLKAYLAEKQKKRYNET